MFMFRFVCLFVWIFCLLLNLIDGDSFYPIPYPGRILVSDDEVTIGSRNSLFTLTLDLTKLIHKQDLTPSDTEYSQCLRNGWPLEDCHNDVSIMLTPSSDQLLPGTQKRMNDTIFTCTTNAYSPICCYRDVSTFQPLLSFNGVNYISSENKYQSANLFTSIGDLFTYKQVGVGEDYVISKHKHPLSPDNIVRTRNYFQTSLWLNEAEVVSMYEEGNFVYIFFREKAIEVTTRISQNQQVYSRVARICKNDLGSNDDENHFLSYQKARISCLYQQTSQTPPYHYNELQDTYKLSGAFDQSTEAFEEVYAVFSSPVNGPVGSAVCAYSFDKNDFDLVKAFRGRYINEESAFTWGFSDERGDINCQADPIRTTEEAKRNVLMQFSVRQAHQSEPLFHLNNQKFVKISVDRVLGLDGNYNEVMFILSLSYESTIDILLHRVTYIADRNPTSKLISSQLIIEDTSDLFVTEMKIFKNIDNRTKEGVILGTGLGIHKIPLHKCYSYKTDKECVESMDPYCVFSCKQQQCVSVYNVNTSNDHFLYNYTTGVVWTCPDTYITPSVSVPISESNTSNSTTTTSKVATTATATTTTITNLITDSIFPLIPLPPVYIEYLIIGIFATSLLFCCLGVSFTVCCIKLTLYGRRIKKFEHMQTETNTFGSDDSSPLPKQFWEPTALPYEVPMNGQIFSQNNLDNYKPCYMQSSPNINQSHSITYSFHPKYWGHNRTSSMISEPLINNKFVSSTFPRSHSSIANIIGPPLPNRVNSNGFLFHPCLNPPNNPTSATAFQQVQLSNKYKKGFPDSRAYTPDFLSVDRRSKSEF